jgi:hypothetical protein
MVVGGGPLLGRLDRFLRQLIIHGWGLPALVPQRTARRIAAVRALAIYERRSAGRFRDWRLCSNALLTWLTVLTVWFPDG